jgi:hypothetical protein
MQLLIISLLAVYGLAFFIKETDGPWGLVSRWRNLMMRVPFIGVQFFKLLDCYFCLGCHCGWIIYLLSYESYKWQFFVLWTLAGGAISLILSGVLAKLHSSHS